MNDEYLKAESEASRRRVLQSVALQKANHDDPSAFCNRSELNFLSTIDPDNRVENLTSSSRIFD